MKLKRKSQRSFESQETLKNNDDSFLETILMGRKLTLPMFVATLVATWYGGIFGVTKIAYENGIYNFLIQGVFWYMTYIIFALWMVKKIHPYQAITLPDLIGKMFGPKASKISAIFNFFNVVPVVYTISLGLFLQVMLDVDILWCMMLGVGLVVVYSTFGGFRAVVFSDLIQFFVMFIGVALILIISYCKFGGIEFLRSNLPQDHLSIMGGHGVAETLVWGLIALSTLVDPNFYQRCFAAKDEKVARNGILISTLCWLVFDICTTGGALYARAVMPELDSKSAYLVYALNLMPDGLRGLILAGIFATILSTIDSYIFLAGTTLTYDLLPKKMRHSLVLHKVSILMVGVLSIALAVFFQGDIKVVWKTLGSYSAACLLLPVIYGHLFYKGAGDKRKDASFVFACLLGVIATTYWRNAYHDGFLGNIDELYVGVVATLLGLISGKWIFR